MQLFKINEGESGLRLRDYLKTKLGELSNKKLKTLIDRGFVLVNHKIERFYTRRLNMNDLVEFDVVVNSQKPKILFSSKDYVIVDKPSDFNCSQKAFRLALHQRLYLVHRLDKDTSGVMVLAKTLEMKEHLEHLFYTRRVEKEYWALTEPFECTGQICIDNPLKIKELGNKKIVSISPYGLEAKTYIRVLERSSSASLVLARPITGRTHQIRVHLKGRGACILGDIDYQEKEKYNEIIAPMMLHSKSLTFSLLNGQIKTYLSHPKKSFIQEMKKREITYNLSQQTS